MRQASPVWKCLLLSVLLAGCAARHERPEYRTVQATEFGKSLLAERTDAKSLTAALQLTLDDLTQYFGAAPSVFKAFADSKDARSGGATFIVAAQGGTVKGLVTCQVGEAKTRVAVTYIRADAPAGEWGRLVPAPAAPARPAVAGTTSNTPSAPASPAAAPAAARPTAMPASGVAQATLSTHVFPDGTGSVGLAEGWTTNSQSAAGAVVLSGPGEATATAGAMYSVLTPRSTLPRGPQTLVASYGTPQDVFVALVPQFSRMSVQKGGPSLAIDGLTKVSDQLGGQLSILRYGITETKPGGARKHYQAMGWVRLSPLPTGNFMVTLTQVRAPDATFERDKPLMFEMLNSVKTNDAAIQRKSSRELSAQRQRFDAQQARMHAQQSANDAQHKQYWEHQKAMEESHKAFNDRQNEVARSNDNFDEYIRGVRTVEDTQTGVKTSVDLGNVDKVVDDLNEHDPGRYREIPLRDEVHPR
jgi:hypothetical protein